MIVNVEDVISTLNQVFASYVKSENIYYYADSKGMRICLARTI